MWWKKNNFIEKKTYLEQRMNMIRAIRTWFEAQNFYEVETPALQICPGIEPHIFTMRTEIIDNRHEKAEYLYLHTSPELAMKKLLVAGMENIFQLCKCYRNAEGSRLHSHEFTMLEWYRAYSGYEKIIDDCISLIREICNKTSTEYLTQGDIKSNPFDEWEIITVSDAFKKYAQFDLEPYLNNTSDFINKVKDIGLHCSESDSWEDLFFRVFLEKIEPNLGINSPCVIYDYPTCMSSLARIKQSDPRFAERFEVYICGIELANAFGELTDPNEQRKRFEFDLQKKKELYENVKGFHDLCIDEDFIQALEYGMPRSSGIALGIDRLAMLITGSNDIEKVLWCG